MSSSTLRSLCALSIALLAMTGACDCNPKVLPHPFTECGNGGLGCLSDEVCVEGQCVAAPKCEEDDDCKSGAYECVLPSQVCKLRGGFAEECAADAPCDPGFFCALGSCRSTDPALGARSCSLRTDCPAGQQCDHQTNFCIPEGPCTLVEEFPELECDAGESCDVLSETCQQECVNECSPADVLEDCGPNQQCNGACRCVDCLFDEHCGPGLICDARAGRCVSENICFSDDDCEDPLICDPGTGVCQAAPPACFTDFDCTVAQVCNLATGRCELPTGPCDDDRFDGLQGSDTPATAELLAVDAGGTRTEDQLMLCPDDDDVYAIPLATGDLLIAEVTGTDPLARATMWLLDSAGETSVRFAETPPRGSGRIQYVAQVDETVFLRVNALVGSSPYDLTLEVASGTPCAADFFEGGTNNDSIVAATDPSLTPDNADLTATVCPEDEDFYRVEVAQGEALSASLTFDDTDTDLDIAFINTFGDIVAQSAGTQQPETLRRRFFNGDTDVFVRVRGFGNDAGPYTLRFDHEPPFVCTPDAREPDGEIITATTVPLNGALAQEARTLCAGDVDLVQLPLEDFERAVIRVLYDDTEIEARVEVLDATATTVLATSPTATGGASLSYDAQGNETVIARVSAIGGAIGPYTIAVTKENQLTCAPDALEPNDSVAAASLIALPFASDLLSICEPDADFFRIDGEGGKKLIVDASFRHAEGDIDLMVLGTDGAQTLAVADGTSDGEHLEVVLPVTGTFTLRVFSLTSDARARYTLTVDQVSP